MGVKGRAKLRDDRLAVAEALDRFDRTPVHLPDGGQAGANRLAVDEHRAGAAIAGVAADLDARQAAFLAQRMTEAFERRSGNARRLAVEAQGDAWRAFEHQTTPPVWPSAQASIARLHQRQGGVATIVRGRADVVDRRQPREVLRLDRPSEARARRRADQSALRFPHPLGDRGAGADGDPRVAHDPLDDVERDGDHHDRNHEIAPGPELEEGRPHRRRGQRRDDRGHHFVRGQQGAAGAVDESIERETARPAPGGEFDFGVEDQQGRDAVGGRRGVAEIAGDRAAILDLDGADVARRDLQRVESRRQIGPRDIAPRRRRADAHGVAFEAHAAQRGYIGDVDVVALQRTLARARKNVSRAGDDAGAAFGQQPQRFVEVGRASVHASGSRVGCLYANDRAEPAPCQGPVRVQYMPDARRARQRAVNCARSSRRVAEGLPLSRSRRYKNEADSADSS